MPNYSWTSAKSGSWNTPANWTPNGVPGTSGGDTATINATGANYTVTYNEPTEAINGLTIDSAAATLAFKADTNLTVTVFNTTSLEAGTIDLLTAKNVLNAGVLTTSAGTTVNMGSGSELNYYGATLGGLIDITGSTTLGTASAGITLNGTIEATGGTGTVKFAALSGSGILEANGAKLLVDSSLANSTVTSVISNSAASVFETKGTLFFGSNVPIHFLGPQGEFQYNNSPNDVGVHFNIAGLNAGPSKTTPTNFIDLADEVVTTVSGGSGLGASGSVVLSNDDVLTFTGITNIGTKGWAAETASDGKGGTEIFLASVCYAGGTQILTTAGERTVESLRQGDFILTVSGDQLVPQQVKWLGRRQVDLRAHPMPEKIAPIRIHRDAFDDRIPHRDLIVSPDHAIFVDGTLICARQLVNGSTIRQEFDRTMVDYYHVELNRHAILLAEGLPAESYIDTGNRGFFANADAPLMLHPNLTDEIDYPTREAGSCVPFVWDEAHVRPVWQRLAERAAVMGRPVAHPVTTMEANLRLLAEHYLVKPVYSDSSVVIFVLPHGAKEARLISRAQSPIGARPWLEDRRRLGVRVNRIVLRGANEQREIPMDHPGLNEGWWAIERDGQMMSRWTNGNAVLPLPVVDGPAMLELHLAGEMVYAVETELESRVQHHAA